MHRNVRPTVKFPMFGYRFNTASRATVIFLLVSALQFLSSWILLPFYLSRFSLEEFGVNELMNRVSIIAGFLVSLRISAAMANQYFQLQDAGTKSRFVSSLFIFTLLTAVLGCLFFFLVGPHLFDFFFAKSGFDFWPYGCTALFTGILGNVMAPGLFFLRNEQRLRSFLLISAGFIAFNFLGQLAAMYFFHFSFRELAITRSAMAMVQMLLMTLWCFRRFGMHFDGSVILRALRYTLPLIPFLVLNWLQLYYDRFFTGREYGATVLGVFSVLLIAGSIHTACVDVFENVYRPDWMRIFMNPDDGALRTTHRAYLSAILVTASAILLACAILPLFTTRPVFMQQASLFMPVVAASVCKGISLLFIQQLVYRERSGWLLIIAALQFIFTWGCYQLFARGQGLERLFLINVLLQLFFTLLFYLAAQKAHTIRHSRNWLGYNYAYVFLLLSLMFAVQQRWMSVSAALGLQILPVGVLFLYSWGLNRKGKLLL